MTKEKEMKQHSSEEVSKLERHKRIQSYSSKKKRKRFSGILFPLVLVAIFVWIAVWYLAQIGILERSLTAMTINNKPIKVVEYNFYFNSLKDNFTQRYGDKRTNLLNLSDQIPEEVYKQSLTIEENKEKTEKAVRESIEASEKGKDTEETTTAVSEAEVSSEETTLDLSKRPTWNEFIHKTTKEQLKSFYIAYDLAVENGLELSNQDSLNITNQINGGIIQTGSKGYFQSRLEFAYGLGMTVDLYREYLEKQALVNKFYQENASAYLPKVSDEKVKELFDKNPEEMERASYFVLDLNVKPVADESGAIKDEAKVEAFNKSKELAEDLVKDVTDIDSLVKKVQQQKYLEAVGFPNIDKSTLFRYSAKKQVFDKELQDWLFSKDLKENSVKVFANEEGQRVQVVLFQNMGIDHRLTANVAYRTLTFVPENSNQPSDDNKNTKKTLAELKQEAEKMIKDATSVERMKDFASSDFQLGALQEVNAATVRNIREYALQEFVFADNTKKGDHELIQIGDTFYIVLVTDRGPSELYQQDLRFQEASKLYLDDANRSLIDPAYDIQKGSFFASWFTGKRSTHFSAY